MNKRPKSIVEHLTPLFIQVGIGIIIVLVIWRLIISLPMLIEINFPLAFSIYDLIAAVMITIVIILLFHFGNVLEVYLNHLITRFSQAGTIAKQAIVLIIIFIAYISYQGVVIVYLNDLDWVYHLFFLIMFLCDLGMLGYSIYSNTGNITELTINAVNQSKKAYPQKFNSSFTVCDQCGHKNNGKSKFCASCGSVLSKSKTCPQCGFELKNDESFCPQCGTRIEAKLEVEEKEMDSYECWRCGFQLAPDAKFCPSCGERVAVVTTTENVKKEAEKKSLCISCKSEIKPGAKFCPFCGSSQLEE
jgi:rRNA maturation endonuclease Nob1